MNVIFLDFDGVINNLNTFDEVDFNNVKWLLEIVKNTNSNVVASTSYKYSFQKETAVNYKNTLYFKYVTLLNEMGIDIFDVTPYVYGNKKSEIIEYLKINRDIKNFLILDDKFISENLMDHQVLIDSDNGLCEEHVKPSIEILNGRIGFYSSKLN